METEEERGVAHLIEHLAFRASRTCPQEFDLVKEASPERVDTKGSKVFHCWAHFNTTDLLAIRGVILLAVLVLIPLSHHTT